MTAPAPARKYATLRTSFGPIPLTLDLYSGAPASEKTSVKRSEYIKDDAGNYHKVGRVSCVSETGEVIDTSRVIKLCESSDGTLVELTDDEIEAHLDIQAGGVSPIVKFMPDTLLGTTYVFDGPFYQTRPSKVESKRGGKKIAVVTEADEKAFALLLAALKNTSTFALVALTVRGKPRFAALRSDGRLYMLKYDDEVRADLPLPTPDLSEGELKYAGEFVNLNFTDSAQPLVDTVSENIRTFIDIKAKGEGVTPQAPAPAVAAPTDFAAALAAACGK